MLDSIFEPFTQVNASRDGTGSGLGIGLALVKSLVEMHGGSVAAASDGPGKGSEFTVRLPVCVVADYRRPKPAGRADTAGAAPPLQVLVVDDNRDLAESTVMFLEGQGHRTRLACDGATAISLAEQHRPDIVLLDIGLPDMDGHAVAARMRTNPHLREAIIIAVSGFKPDEHDGHLPHFNAHLVKPFRPEVLLELIRNKQPRESAQRILLIEDNQELARLTAELLRGHAQQVEIAFSGSEGIEKAKQFHPRIVLCDLNLPDMKGVEVARALRDTASATPLVLVGVSAASVEDLQAGHDSTVFDQFWSKPLTWGQVHELIHSLESDESAKGAGR
jgi:CheY-like chemotaxis protein